MGWRRGLALLGRLARANLSKASLSACCKAKPQSDKRRAGYACLSSILYQLDITSQAEGREDTARWEGRREGDVKSCFSEYPYRYLEQNKKHQPKLICPLEIISRPMLLSHEMLVVIGKLYKTGQEGM
jgi:hypothetical protein